MKILSSSNNQQDSDEEKWTNLIQDLLLLLMNFIYCLSLLVCFVLILFSMKLYSLLLSYSSISKCILSIFPQIIMTYFSDQRWNHSKKWNIEK